MEFLMQRRSFVLAATVAIAMSGLGATTVFSADAAPANCKCPVSGKAVNAEKFSDYNGGKVYFCCDVCKGKFDKDSAAFTAKANHQLVCSGQYAQKACPFTGGKVKDGTEVDVAGVKVGFCCMNCKGKAAKATGDDQVKLVFGDAFAKGFAKK